MNPSSYWFILSVTACTLQLQQIKGKEQTVKQKRLQQRMSNLLSQYIIFHTAAQHPSQVFFQRQVLVTRVLVLMVRRSKAGPDLLRVYETSTENSDCRRQGCLPSRSGLSWALPQCEKRPSNPNHRYLMSTGNPQHGSVLRSAAHSHWDIINGNQYPQ